MTATDLIPTACIYESNPTSAIPLCYMWCQIQIFLGFECITCPDEYKQDPEHQLLCNLHQDLTLMQNNVTLSLSEGSESTPAK